MKNFDWSGSTLYINVDPLPVGEDPMATISAAQKYFPRVVWNIAEDGNFPRAVQWTWAQTTSGYVFNLQDDWALDKDIDVAGMIETLEKSSNDVVQLKLDIQNNGMIVLAPALLKGSFVRWFAPQITHNMTPEEQMKALRMRSVSWTHKLHSDQCIRDTGRDWRFSRGLDRRGDGLWTSWIVDRRQFVLESLKSTYGEGAIHLNGELVITPELYATSCNSYPAYRAMPYSVLRRSAEIIEQCRPKTVLTFRNRMSELLLQASNCKVEFFDSRVSSSFDFILSDRDNADGLVDYCHADTHVIVTWDCMVPVLSIRSKYRGMIECIYNPLLLNRWEASNAFVPQKYIK